MALLISSVSAEENGTTDSPPKVDEDLAKEANQLTQLSDPDLKDIKAMPPGIGGERDISLKQAIALLLRKSPVLSVSESAVDLAEGQLTEAIGAFDPVVQSTIQALYSEATQNSSFTNPYLSNIQNNPPLLYNSSTLSDNQIKASAGMTKLFRNGLSAGPFLGFTSDTGENQISENADAFLGVFVNVPLLRNLGEDSQYTTLEKAARIEADVAKLNLEYTISTQILTLLNEYWDLRSAQDAVKVAQINEIDGKKLVGLTEALVQGYVVPSIQIDQAKANLEQFSTQKIAARQAQSRASQTLAITLGFSPMELFDEPVATDDFPNPNDTKIDNEVVKELVHLALARRADLKAAQMTTQAAQILVRGARNATLPQVDFAIGAGGISDGTTNNSINDTSDTNELGVGIGASLTIDWPTLNNTAKGLLAQQLATLGQSRAQELLTQSEVASDVILAAKGLLNARNALVETTEAVKNQRKSLAAQQEMFTMGMTSLVEVITTQTSLSAIEMDLIEAKAGYATAIAQMRHATGTLLPEPKNNRYEFDTSTLLQIPDPGELVRPDTPILTDSQISATP
tara:strand:- start:14875 stop:16587 length:1713 start_codon:yes stop_codon:yes gene_type:complete